MKVIQTNFREYLQRYGSLTYRISGQSMLPMLRQEKDLVTVTRYDGRPLKKYDIAMYDRGNGEFVLHRIVAVCEDERGRWYTFQGDHNLFREYEIPEESIVAVLVSFDRGGREIPVTHPGFRLYSRFWYCIGPVRRSYRFLRKRISRIPLFRRLHDRLRKF